MHDHLRHATVLADVPWLERSRRAYQAWPVRLGALLAGCALLGAAVEAELATAALLAVTAVGVGVAGAGLLMGAAYGRIVGALAAALAVGYAPHWLAARVAAREGEPRALAAELEQLADRQPA